MSISYTYEIISVDPQARAMEVVYSAPGHQTMHIGARLPFVGESLESVIEMFSPVPLWLEQATEVVVPELGAGQIVPAGAPPPPDLTLDGAKRAKLEEIANWRWVRETSGVVFHGVRIKTDRESQALINGAFASMQAGLITSVDWKAANGQWLTIGLPEMTAIAQVVATHVQTAFSMERQFMDQVAAATTFEDVQAITLSNMPVTEF
jgi:hypothetical protein